MLNIIEIIDQCCINSIFLNVARGGVFCPTPLLLNKFLQIIFIEANKWIIMKDQSTFISNNCIIYVIILARYFLICLNTSMLIA